MLGALARLQSLPATAPPRANATHKLVNTIHRMDGHPKVGTSTYWTSDATTNAIEKTVALMIPSRGRTRARMYATAATVLHAGNRTQTMTAYLVSGASPCPISHSMIGRRQPRLFQSVNRTHITSLSVPHASGARIAIRTDHATSGRAIKGGWVIVAQLIQVSRKPAGSASVTQYVGVNVPVPSSSVQGDSMHTCSLLFACSGLQAQTGAVRQAVSSRSQQSMQLESLV